jgi:hypothetical protein
MDIRDSTAGAGPARGVRRFAPVRMLLVAGGVLMAFLLAAATTSAHGADRARARPPVVSALGGDPVLGSWYAQVHFPGIPFPGRTEATMMTFTPGGGLVEANPINQSPAGNSGYWRRDTDGVYHLRLLNFTWDPVISGAKQLLDVDITFVMTDRNHFHSVAASAVVYYFDPQTGQRLQDPVTVPDVTVTTAERFSTWKVPAAFPAEPQPQP